MADLSLSLLVLKTRQLESARRFFTSLGIELVEEQHGSGPAHCAGRVGDVVLEVYPLPEDGTPADTTTRLGFVIERVAEVVDSLRAIGARVDSEPRATKWGFRAVVRDPDGRAVELTQR
jgi:lactoylglutathione lyase